MNDIKSIAQEIIDLEEKCSLGINVSENLQKMEKLMLELPFEELLELNLEIEKNFLKK